MLYVLKDADPKLRRAILRHADDDVIKTINEIAYNTLKGNTKLSGKVKNSLNPYKKELRCLKCPKKTLKSKRKLLVQKGGFLPVLIGSILSGLIGKLLENV